MEGGGQAETITVCLRVGIGISWTRVLAGEKWRERRQLELKAQQDWSATLTS